MNLRERIVTLK